MESFTEDKPIHLLASILGRQGSKIWNICNESSPATMSLFNHMLVDGEQHQREVSSTSASDEDVRWIRECTYRSQTNVGTHADNNTNSTAPGNVEEIFCDPLQDTMRTEEKVTAGEYVFPVSDDCGGVTAELEKPLPSGDTHPFSATTATTMTGHTSTMTDFYAHVLQNFAASVTEGNVNLTYTEWRQVAEMPIGEQYDVTQLHDPNSLRKRFELKEKNKRVQCMMHSIWDLVPKVCDTRMPVVPGETPKQYINFNMFRVLTAFIFRRLMPNSDLPSFLRLVMEDWKSSLTFFPRRSRISTCQPSADESSPPRSPAVLVLSVEGGGQGSVDDATAAKGRSRSLFCSGSGGYLLQEGDEHLMLMDQVQFEEYMFSLVDVWTLTISEGEYIQFLKQVVHKQALKVQYFDPIHHIDIGKYVFGNSTYNRKSFTNPSPGGYKNSPKTSAISPKASAISPKASTKTAVDRGELKELHAISSTGASAISPEASKETVSSGELKEQVLQTISSIRASTTSPKASTKKAREEVNDCQIISSVRASTVSPKASIKKAAIEGVNELQDISSTKGSTVSPKASTKNAFVIREFKVQELQTISSTRPFAISPKASTKKTANEEVNELQAISSTKASTVSPKASTKKAVSGELNVLTFIVDKEPAPPRLRQTFQVIKMRRKEDVKLCEIRTNNDGDVEEGNKIEALRLQQAVEGALHVEPAVITAGRNNITSRPSPHVSSTESKTNSVAIKIQTFRLEFQNDSTRGIETPNVVALGSPVISSLVDQSSDGNVDINVVEVLLDTQQQQRLAAEKGEVLRIVKKTLGSLRYGHYDASRVLVKSFDQEVSLDSQGRCSVVLVDPSVPLHAGEERGQVVLGLTEPCVLYRTAEVDDGILKDLNCEARRHFLDWKNAQNQLLPNDKTSQEEVTKQAEERRVINDTEEHTLGDIIGKPRREATPNRSTIDDVVKSTTTPIISDPHIAMGQDQGGKDSCMTVPESSTIPCGEKEEHLMDGPVQDHPTLPAKAMLPEAKKGSKISTEEPSKSGKVVVKVGILAKGVSHEPQLINSSDAHFVVVNSQIVVHNASVGRKLTTHCRNVGTEVEHECPPTESITGEPKFKHTTKPSALVENLKNRSRNIHVSGRHTQQHHSGRRFCSEVIPPLPTPKLIKEFQELARVVGPSTNPITHFLEHLDPGTSKYIENLVMPHCVNNNGRLIMVSPPSNIPVYQTAHLVNADPTQPLLPKCDIKVFEKYDRPFLEHRFGSIPKKEKQQQQPLLPPKKFGLLESIIAGNPISHKKSMDSLVDVFVHIEGISPKLPVAVVQPLDDVIPTEYVVAFNSMVGERPSSPDPNTVVEIVPLPPFVLDHQHDLQQLMMDPEALLLSRTIKAIPLVPTKPTLRLESHIVTTSIQLSPRAPHTTIQSLNAAPFFRGSISTSSQQQQQQQQTVVVELPPDALRRRVAAERKNLFQKSKEQEGQARTLMLQRYHDHQAQLQQQVEEEQVRAQKGADSLCVEGKLQFSRMTRMQQESIKN